MTVGRDEDLIKHIASKEVEDLEQVCGEAKRCGFSRLWDNTKLSQSPLPADHMLYLAITDEERFEYLKL